jgi:hypothetical protein
MQADAPPPGSAASSPAARHLADAQIAALAQAAASDESAARGRNITLLLVLGFVGAVGLAARPLYRASFAERAAVEAAIQRAARSQRREEGAERLQQLLARLEELERAHQKRAPYAALLERAAADGGGGSDGGGEVRTGGAGEEIRSSANLGSGARIAVRSEALR